MQPKLYLTFYGVMQKIVCVFDSNLMSSLLAKRYQEDHASCSWGAEDVCN